MYDRPSLNSFREKCLLLVCELFRAIYGRMRGDSPLSLVYRLTSAVAAVTIESMGETPPFVLCCAYVPCW